MIWTKPPVIMFNMLIFRVSNMLCLCWSGHHRIGFQVLPWCLQVAWIQVAFHSGRSVSVGGFGSTWYMLVEGFMFKLLISHVYGFWIRSKEHRSYQGFNFLGGREDRTWGITIMMGILEKTTLMLALFSGLSDHHGFIDCVFAKWQVRKIIVKILERRDSQIDLKYVILLMEEIRLNQLIR